MANKQSHGGDYSRIKAAASIRGPRAVMAMSSPSAGDADCIDPDKAAQVISECMAANNVGGVAKTTTIGDVLPGAAANAFCACVQRRSGVSDFECGADKTFLDVEASIAC